MRLTEVHSSRSFTQVRLTQLSRLKLTRQYWNLWFHNRPCKTESQQSAPPDPQVTQIYINYIVHQVSPRLEVIG